MQKTEAKNALNTSAFSVSLFGRWPSSSSNGPMLFLLCLLPLIYSKKHFLISPYSFGQLLLQLSFGHTNFLPTAASNISVFFPHQLKFLPLAFPSIFLKKVPVQPSQPSASPLWLVTYSNRLRRWCLYMIILLPFVTMLFSLALLLKHLMSAVSEGSYSYPIVLERHETPLGNLWVN